MEEGMSEISILLAEARKAATQVCSMWNGCDAIVNGIVCIFSHVLIVCYFTCCMVYVYWSIFVYV